MNPKIEAITKWLENSDIGGDFSIGRDPDPSSRLWKAVIYNGDGEQINLHNGEEILVGMGRTEAEAIDCFIEENLIQVENAHIGS